MRVLPTAQHALRQVTEISSTAFPSAIRTLASIIASITMVITIYLGYRKCMRGRDGSFTADRGQEQAFSIPLTSYEEPGNAYSDEYLPVYVGGGRYVYVSRNELPRDPPHTVRRDASVPPRFDANTLKQFEATNEEKQHPCPICLEELETEPVSAGQCLHLMHTSCLTSWLNKDVNSNCPVCRVRIEESASFDMLRGKVIELPSLAHAPGERNGVVSIETGLRRQDGVILPATDNMASIQVETEAASQPVASEPTQNTRENNSESNGERDSSQQENAGRPSMSEVHTQSGVDNADVLATQQMGSSMVGGSGRISLLGNDQEVAVANK